MTRRRYTNEEVRRALEIHAVNNGNSVDLRTIRRWETGRP